MENCKVTVILPSLNVVDYIEECLKSVCQQTLREIEIICVDAGSIDGTTEIIQKYALEDKRIKVINSEKKSYGYQVNMGIREAKGEYIAVLETDDYVDLGMYESLYQIAESMHCDYVKANFRYFFTDSEGNRIFWNSDTFSYNKCCYNRILNAWELKDANRYDTSIWSGIYRRDFIIKNGIECNESKGAAFQDIGFLQQVFWKADKAYYTEKKFYNYCTDREESSTNKGNGLAFAYQEYQFLLSSKIQSDKECENISCIYERMADVFEENFKKIIAQGKEEENKDIIQWFLNILWQKERENVIHRTYLQCFINNPDKWIYQYREQFCSKRMYVEDLLNQLKGHTVIIFGAGIWGKLVYRKLDNQGIFVAGFCDNNPLLWGEEISDKKIYSPKEINPVFINEKYVIANKLHSSQIKEQLIEQGVREADIIIWRIN